MWGCSRGGEAGHRGAGSLAVRRTGDAQGTVVAAVGTMHRKLEREAGRHAAGGREPLRSTEGCTQAGGGSSAEPGTA